MPFKIVRRSVQGRPRRSARTRSGGKMVSTICHCSSVKSISPHSTLSLKVQELIYEMASSNESSRKLEEQLKASGQSPRSVAERVGLFFPRRNIETWIEFLNTGSPADEKKRYPKLTEESDCYTGVDKLAAKNDYHLSSDVPAALPAACPEIRRIFPQKSCIDESAGTA